MRCPRCSRWTDAQRAEIVRRACIPPRFARASLNNFDVPKGDALRKSILESARALIDAAREAGKGGAERG
jgi:hypothetical protein